MNVNEYLARKAILTYTPYFITSSGEEFFVENGVKYTRKAFNKKYPLPVSLVMHNSENSDKTKSYLHAD